MFLEKVSNLLSMQDVFGYLQKAYHHDLCAYKTCARFMFCGRPVLSATLTCFG